MSPCGVGSPVHLDNQPASTVATLASVKPMVIRHISLHIPTELDNVAEERKGRVEAGLAVVIDYQ